MMQRHLYPYLARWGARGAGAFAAFALVLGCAAPSGSSGAPQEQDPSIGKVRQAASPCAGVVCPECRKCQAGACVTDNQAGSCTDDGNPCSIDVCSSGVCTHTTAAPAATVCRAAADECDVAESCTGASTACPADGKASALTACSDDGNPCSVDQCDGTGNACRHTAGNAGATCRAGSGVCDVAEVCNGSSTTCPPDAFASAGTACRGAVDECDAVEACSGLDAACPADVTVANGTPCDDGSACSGTDSCSGGQCVGSNLVTCPAPDGCHTPGVCDPSTGTCSAATPVAGCSLAALDYVRVSVEYTTPQAVMVVPECNATNNWSATKGSPQYDCGSQGGVEALPFTVSRAFHAVCPSGQSSVWLGFGYASSTPEGTSIEFRFRSFPATGGVCVPLASVTVDPPGPIAIASLSGDPESCPITGGVGCPKALDTYLGTAGAQQECLQMDAYGVPEGAEGPLLFGWSVTYDCRDAR